MKKDILKDIIDSVDAVEYQKTLVKMSISAAIYDGMVNKGISKKELALKMRKQPSVITRWLRGTHNFTIETIIDLQFILSIKIIK